MPEPFIKGLIPTLNRRGFMTESLDPYSIQFAEFAGSIDDEVLDIGCAYGVATLAALEQGARVLACDMEQEHLEVLKDRVPDDWLNRLRTKQGLLPDIDFEEASFGSILASRVIHFLAPDEIRITFKKFSDWLKPDGRLYVLADTPYVSFWAGEAPKYEKRKAEGDLWPSLIEDASVFPGGKFPDGHPPFIHPLDSDILAREAEIVGLQVTTAKMIVRADASKDDKPVKGHCVLVAEKTNG